MMKRADASLRLKEVNMQIIINILAGIGAITLICTGFVVAICIRSGKQEAHEVSLGEYRFDKRV